MKKIRRQKTRTFLQSAAPLAVAALMACSDVASDSTSRDPIPEGTIALCDDSVAETVVNFAAPELVEIFNNDWSTFASESGLDPWQDVYSGEVDVPKKYFCSEACALTVVYPTCEKSYVNVDVTNLQGLGDFLLDEYEVSSATILENSIRWSSSFTEEKKCGGQYAYEWSGIENKTTCETYCSDYAFQVAGTPGGDANQGGMYPQGAEVCCSYQHNASAKKCRVSPANNAGWNNDEEWEANKGKVDYPSDDCATVSGSPCNHAASLPVSAALGSGGELKVSLKNLDFDNKCKSVTGEPWEIVPLSIDELTCTSKNATAKGTLDVCISACDGLTTGVITSASVSAFRIESSTNLDCSGVGGDFADEEAWLISQLAPDIYSAINEPLQQQLNEEFKSLIGSGIPADECSSE